MMHPITIEAGEKYEAIREKVSNYFIIELGRCSQKDLEKEKELKKSINELHNYYVNLVERLPNENIPKVEKNNLVFNILANNNHVMQRWGLSLDFKIDLIPWPEDHSGYLQLPQE